MTPKWRTISLLVLASAAGMSLWFITAAILPDITAEQGLSSSQQTLLSSAVQAGFVIGALLIAITGLSDRLDPRRVLSACAIGTALASAALLIVPLNGWGAIGLRFLAGALMAGVYPVGMKIAVGWGLTDRGMLVGALVGALTLGKSIPYGLAWAGGADWRLVLALGSIAGALGGLAALFTSLGPYHRAALDFEPRAIRLLWSDRGIRAAFLGYIGHMWELYVLWGWIGAAATASYLISMTPEDAVSFGKFTAFIAIGAGAPACFFAGQIADRIGKARIAALAMAVSGTIAVLTALSFGGAPWLVFALFVLWGIAVVPDSAQFSALVADHAPAELTGSLLTLQTAFGFLLTVITVQLAPWAAETFGWPILLAGLALGPVFGIWALRPLLGRSAGPDATAGT